MTADRPAHARLVFAAWIAWTAWVVTHYFVVPADRFVPINGALAPPAFWPEALGRALRALFGASAIVLAAWGCADLALKRGSNLFATRGERVTVLAAAGLALLAYVFIALAFLKLLRPGVIVGVVLVAATVGAARLATNLDWRALDRLPRLSTADRTYAVCIAAAFGCAFAAALAPETEYDALWYHLWLPVKWIAAHGPVDVIDEYVSLYPLTWEMLYGAASVLGGTIAAKLLHFVCLPLVAGGAALITRRLFPRASAMLAAAIAITAPIVLWEATTAYVDLALACYVTLAVYSLIRYDDTRRRGWLILAALLVGVALAIKHLAMLAFVIMAVVLAAREAYRSGRRAVTTVALFAAIAVLPPLPWYVRAYTASGNPVFPEMYSVFGAEPAERWSADTERGFQQFKNHFGPPRTPANLLLLPWDVTVHGARYSGTVGPFFLIFIPIALLASRRRTTWPVAAACGAYVGLWASPVSSFQLRFLVPVVPLLAALAAEGVAIVSATLPRFNVSRAAAAFVAVALLAMNLPPMIEWHERDRHGWLGWLTHIVRGVPASVVTGMESEQAYLARTVPSYRAWQFMDRELPRDVRVLAFVGGDELYASRPRLWSDSVLARPLTWATPAGRETDALAAARQLGVTHVLFDKRQFEDGSVSALALGTSRMRACCLQRLYEDDRYALYAIGHEHIE